jgi:hypothetical protein
MFWFKKVLAPAIILAGMTAAIGLAQPPGSGQPPEKKEPGQKKGPGEKKGFGDKKGFPDRFGEKKGPPLPFGPGGPRGRGERADPAVEAWVKVLLDKITDPHDTIRDSARAAVVNVGPPALPALRQLADGDDGAKATAARKLIGAIEGSRGGPGSPAKHSSGTWRWSRR